MKPFLLVDAMTKQFAGADQAALEAVSFDISSGEFVTLVGASGSGKTTLLRLLAGLEEPDAGEVRLGEEVLSRGQQVLVPPERRNFGFVFQNHALFPHLSVGANVAFGLGRPGNSKKRVDELLDLVGLGGLEHRFPHELSGGEQQRIALIRALAPGPRLLLMDEPFSSLDKSLRQELRSETRRLVDEQGATTIMVTHDTSDALAVSDRLVVLRMGKVEQIGTPRQIYRQPVNRYVASAFGNCNFLTRSALGDSPAVESIEGIEPAAVASDELWVRPEDLLLAAPGLQTEFTVGVVSEVAFNGHSQLVTLACEGQGNGNYELQASHAGHQEIAARGQKMGVSFRPASGTGS